MTRSARSAAILARQIAASDPEGAALILGTARGQTARSLGAMAANAADHAFMDWMRDQTAVGRKAGIVGKLKRVGPAVRFVGRGLCEPVGKGPADFQGYLAAAYGWRPLAAEAKTRDGRLALSEIPEHQAHDLVGCAADGGLALLLYEHRDGVVCVQYAMPWAEVPWRSVRKGAGPSVGPEECAPWRVRGALWVELVERGVVERPAPGLPPEPRRARGGG